MKGWIKLNAADLRNKVVFEILNESEHKKIFNKGHMHSLFYHIYINYRQRSFGNSYIVLGIKCHIRNYITENI